MEYELYKYELEELIDDLRLSMKQDQNDYVFTVTENRGHIAMMLIEESGEIYINEQGRERLKALWSVAYENNIQKLIPDFAQQLYRNELPIYGTVIVKR